MSATRGELAARLSATPGVVDHGLFPPQMVTTSLVASRESVGIGSHAGAVTGAVAAGRLRGAGPTGHGGCRSPPQVAGRVGEDQWSAGLAPARPESSVAREQPRQRLRLVRAA